jgi:inhibitor of KinA
VTPTVEPAGDQGFVVRFGADIDPALGDRVLALLAALDPDRPAGVEDVVPGYAAVLVVYDAAIADADAVKAWIEEALAACGAAPAISARRIDIPVLYDAAVAPDLEPLAAEKGLAPDALAALHAACEYRCYLLGFRPGFPFLGGLDARLWSARLASPRVRVPAGSVGIGGRQTGVYPVDGPGGWRIIGRTPLRLFDPGRDDPFLVHAGDRVRFVAIDAAEYRRLRGT